MARCDFAEQHILPDNATEPTIRATQVIMHSIDGAGVTPLEQISRWKAPGSVLESHFIVGRDGKAYQTMDTGRSADANLKANRRPDGTGAISIETEDNIGHPDVLPWTDEQVNTLIRLGLWAARTHDIPRRRCPDPDSPGFGYHTLFGSPSAWTPKVKSCPGTVRIEQWEDKILPDIVAGRDPEVGVSKKDVLDALKDPDGVKLVRKAVWGGKGDEIPSIFGTTSAAQVVEQSAKNIQELVNIVRQGQSALSAKISSVHSAVLGALAAMDTSSLSDADREELARRISALDNSLEPAVVAEAVSVRLTP
jgi:hypothetical protein